jgi:4-hydroxybutyrate CoA-transferase
MPPPPVPRPSASVLTVPDFRPASSLAFHLQSRKLSGIQTVHIHTEGKGAQLQPGVSGIRDRSYFTGSNARAAINEGRADYVPIFLSEIPLLFRRGTVPVNIALINVSPADKHGFHSLGPSVDITRAALQAADHIVAMVNPQVPRTFGDASIHQSHIDVVWHNEAPLATLPVRKPRDMKSSAASAASAADAEATVEETIGKLIAENLVSDGATLQMGIGGIPDAVLRHLGGHKDLGIHSEMFSDGILKLVESGVITNAHKTLHAGKITGGFAIGSKKLYDFLDDNAGIVMRDIAFVNDTYNIARQPKMTAINSCVEIDLTGQVVSDSIGHRIYSGVGGQMDFIRGAGLCPDGVPILALPSVTSKGESRICFECKPGGGVVTTRAHVHWVVTEFGMANLWGKSLRERAEALISIAHPEHRDKLRKMAKDSLIL